MSLIIFALIIILIFILILKERPVCIFDDEEESVTTTTVIEEPDLRVSGTLTRGFDAEQHFVIDPVDKKKIWLNSSDDLYEDAAGKVWRLI